jgi:hypothetical protein
MMEKFSSNFNWRIPRRGCDDLYALNDSKRLDSLLSLSETKKKHYRLYSVVSLLSIQNVGPKKKIMK